ncbi:MAG: hypothetical protein E6Q98_12370 [Rhodospirillaceae bacterium]|nr:MAG: hypothetical protein E6Q98_12370 [Rhodospirillaceae bacterium]
MAHENREFAIAGLARGKAISTLNIGIGKTGEALQIIDRAGWLLIGRQGSGAKHKWQDADQPAEVTMHSTPEKRAAPAFFHKLPHEQEVTALQMFAAADGYSQ